jgi:hypothetical protein
VADGADAGHVDVAEDAGTGVRDELAEVSGAAGETARESEFTGGTFGVAELAGGSGDGRGERVEVAAVAGTGLGSGVVAAELGGVAGEAGGDRVGGAVETGVVAGDAGVVEVVEPGHAQALSRGRVECAGVCGPAGSAVSGSWSVAALAGDEAGLARRAGAVVIEAAVAGTGGCGYV